MKKFFLVALSLTLAAFVTACSSSDSSSSIIPESMFESESSVSSQGGTLNSQLRIGIGVVSTTAESIAASDDNDGTANFSAAICALIIDDMDKIVDVRFDTVQSDVAFDVSGVFTGDIYTDIKTKRELGYDYGLKQASEIGKEWFEQMDSLEAWMRGKTINDVNAMELTTEGKAGVPDIDELRSSVTISVTDQMKALEKAYDDAKK